MNREPDQGLSVRNLQRQHKVDSRRLKAFMVDVADEVGAAGRAATVALVRDERMRVFNRRFRGSDKPTDVLSFRADSGDDGDYLGDIVISVDTAERQARRRGSHLMRELLVLTLHGFLHLLGYDHESDDGEMRRLEYRLRRRFGITTRRAGSG